MSIINFAYSIGNVPRGGSCTHNSNCSSHLSCQDNFCLCIDEGHRSEIKTVLDAGNHDDYFLNFCPDFGDYDKVWITSSHNSQFHPELSDGWCYEIAHFFHHSGSKINLSVDATQNCPLLLRGDEDVCYTDFDFRDNYPLCLHEKINTLGYFDSLGDSLGYLSDIFVFSLKSGYSGELVKGLGNYEITKNNVVLGYSNNFQILLFSNPGILWTFGDENAKWFYDLRNAQMGEISSIDLRDGKIVIYNIPSHGGLTYNHSSGGYFTVVPIETTDIHFQETNEDGIIIGNIGDGENYDVTLKNVKIHALLKDVYFFATLSGEVTFSTDGETGILDITGLSHDDHIEFYNNANSRGVVVEMVNGELVIMECGSSGCSPNYEIAQNLGEDVLDHFSTSIQIIKDEKIVGLINASGNYYGALDYEIIDGDCDEADGTDECDSETEGALCTYYPALDDWQWNCDATECYNYCMDELLSSNNECINLCNFGFSSCTEIDEEIVCCSDIGESIHDDGEGSFECCPSDYYYCEGECSSTSCDDELECPDDYEYCGDYCSNEGCSHEQNPCTLAGAECGYLGDDTEPTDTTDNTFSESAELSGTQAGSGSIYCGGCSGEQTCDANNQCILGNDPDPDCDEDWDCTDWTECVDGQQTRTCTDLNDCGTTESRPSLDQSCEPNPECEIDDDCLQGQECNDDGNCDNIIPQIINIGAR